VKRRAQRPRQKAGGGFKGGFSRLGKAGHTAQRIAQGHLHLLKPV
jgi:hypothetical protein